MHKRLYVAVVLLALAPPILARSPIALALLAGAICFWPALPPAPLLLGLAALALSTPLLWTAGQAAAWAVLLPLAAASWRRIDIQDRQQAALIAGVVYAASVLLYIDANGLGIGYLANANIAGALLAILLIIALSRRSWAVASLLLIALATTDSIGAMVAATTGAGYLYLTLGDRWRRFSGWIAQHKHMAGIGALAAILAMSAAFFLLSRSHVWRNRPVMWIMSVYLVSEHPTGLGPDGFRLAWADYRTRYLVPDEYEYEHDHPHNIPLAAAVATGIPGLAAAAWLAAWAWKTAQPEGRAALLVIFTQGMVDSASLCPVVLMTAAVVILPALGDRQIRDRSTIMHSRGKFLSSGLCTRR